MRRPRGPANGGRGTAAIGQALADHGTGARHRDRPRCARRTRRTRTPVTNDDNSLVARLDAYRAEVVAFRAENEAYRAEAAAWRAEVVAWRERLDARFDALDREVGLIARRLMGVRNDHVGMDRVGADLRGHANRDRVPVPAHVAPVGTRGPHPRGSTAGPPRVVQADDRRA